MIAELLKTLGVRNAVKCLENVPKTQRTRRDGRLRLFARWVVLDAILPLDPPEGLTEFLRKGSGDGRAAAVLAAMGTQTYFLQESREFHIYAAAGAAVIALVRNQQVEDVAQVVEWLLGGHPCQEEAELVMAKQLYAALTAALPEDTSIYLTKEAVQALDALAMGDEVVSCRA